MHERKEGKEKTFCQENAFVFARQKMGRFYTIMVHASVSYKQDLFVCRSIMCLLLQAIV
jgi:hypothetical protein